MDADLWSSLAVRVFDALSVTLKEEFAVACLAHLTSLKERAAQLAAEQQHLGDQQAALDRKIEEQRKVREAADVELRSFGATLAAEIGRKIASDPKVEEVLRLMGKQVEVGKRELDLWRRELTTLAGRARRWWQALTSSQQLLRVALVLGATAAVPIIVGLVASTGAAILASLIPLLGAAVRGSLRVRAFAKKLASPLDDAISSAARIDAEVRAQRTPDELRLEAERDHGRARITELTREQETVAKRQLELQVELARLRGGDARTMREFILERAGADDYRKNLGVISAIHRDFQELAKFLAPDWRPPAIAPQLPGTSPTVAPVTAPVSAPDVERIVLYIDDLDRCPPKRVVEVLQAIHIILSLPLFVVVVAVDSRWLLDSLATYYREQFPDRAHHGERARPQQYLEKIFQIPYTLLPMSDFGYDTLVNALVLSAVPPPLPPPLPPPPPPRAGATRAAVTTGSGEQAATIARVGTPSAPQPGPIMRTARPEAIDLTPQSLELEAAEVAHLRRLSGLLPSPRSAKRLVNLYRIVRASLDDDELGELIAVWHPHVQLYLAIVLGSPVLAVRIFEKAMTGTLEDLARWITDRRAPTSSGIKKLTARNRAALDAMLGSLRTPAVANSPEGFRRAVRQVARFSFETGRLLSRFPAESEPAEPSSTDLSNVPAADHGDVTSSS